MDKVLITHAFSHEDIIKFENFLNLFVINQIDKTISYQPSEKYIHTVWGKLVMPHYNGSWEHCDYAFIVPLKNQIGRIFKINPSDTMIFKKLNINQTNSYFVYNECKFNLFPDHEKALESLSSIGFKLIPYNKQSISEDEKKYLIKQIESKITSSGLYQIHSPNGKTYSLNINTDYSYPVIAAYDKTCNNKYNDKKELITMLEDDSLFTNPLMEGVDNFYLQVKDIMDGCALYKFNLKQINTLYIDYVDMITIGKTLRVAINELIPRNSFINNHCNSTLYPDQKDYIRFLELSLEGRIYGEAAAALEKATVSEIDGQKPH